MEALPASYVVAALAVVFILVGTFRAVRDREVVLPSWICWGTGLLLATFSGILAWWGA